MTIIERLRVKQEYFRGDAIVFLRAVNNVVKLHRGWLQLGQHCSTGAECGGTMAMQADADQQWPALKTSAEDKSLHLLPKLSVDPFEVERVEGTPEGAGQSQPHTKELVLHGAGQSNPNMLAIEDL